jgi:thiol-disulfide isomerase/thioredoxin
MKTPLLRAALLSALVLGAAPGVAAAPAPRLAVAAVNDLPQPLPLPYDEAANGMADVAKGRALARHQHKRLLIDLGGNWCPDCRVLAGTMALPDLKRFIDRHFVVVKVDIGRYDKNGDVALHYGITKRLDGVPAVLVVDPVHDTLVNRDRYFALTDARHMTPQALADWLAQWS